MRDPIDNRENDVATQIIEELTTQTLSAFRGMLVERITEDVRYEMKENYSTPDGWEDVYADNRQAIEEAVYEAVYDNLTYKLNK